MGVEIIVSENLSFKRVLQLFKKMQPTNEVLVFLYDGLQVYGAWIARHSEGGKLIAWAESRQVKLTIAIEEIVGELSQVRKGLPKTCLLASAEVFANTVEPPLTEKIAKDKLASQIAWELESIVGERVQKWSIGVLLEGLGYLTAKQRHSIAVELELNREQHTNQTIRFGDVCLQHGYLQREQLNEILMIQERLMELEGVLDCAWQSPLRENIETDEMSMHSAKQDERLWFASGIYRHNRYQWRDAFKRNGIKLTHIFPIHGLSGAFLDLSVHQEYESLLLEVFHERFVVSRFIGPSIVSVDHISYEGSEDLFESAVMSLSGLMRPDTKSVWVNCTAQVNEDFLEHLKQKFDLPFTMVSSRLDGVTNGVSPGYGVMVLMDVLSQLVIMHHRHLIPAIEAQDPKPPIWKNKEIWRLSIPLWAVLLVVANESYTQYQMSVIESKMAEVEKKRDDNSLLEKQMQVLVSESNKAQSFFDKVNEKYETFSKSLVQLELLQARNPLLVNLLVALQKSVNESVVIEIFKEKKLVESKVSGGFELTAWALNENSAQAFSKQLDREVDDLGHEVLNVRIIRAVGRTGARGHEVSLLISPKSIDADKPKSIEVAK